MLEVYKASAGSGKTFTLAREYIRLLLSSPEREARAHSRILAVTFTKKATAEMKERILKELFRLATDTSHSPYIDDFQASLHLSMDALQNRAQHRLYHLLQDYSHFMVSTIDGFFQQIVRSFARELGLPAMYSITLDGDEVVEKAVDDLLFSMRQRGDMAASDSEVWLTEFAMQNIAEGKRWNPREAIESISSHLLTERLQLRLLEIREVLLDKSFLRDYKHALQSILARGQSEWYKKRNLSPEVEARKRDYFTAEAILHNIDALGVLADVAAQIALTNREENRLPISDINLLLHRVIDHSDTPFIYEKTGTRLHHFMIDEFQDTSTLQWENFRPLVSEANANGYTNLIVGDTKQSIYRWRNSDWHLLEGVSSEIQPCVLPTMDTNYRSSYVVVEGNNELFARYASWASETVDAVSGSDKSYGSAIRQAYTTLVQKAHLSDSPGRYRMTFFEGTVSEAESRALDALVPILEDVRRRGIAMGEVAVLVRNGKEAQRVTRYLIDAGYAVQSAEGLLVSSHPAVELLTCLMAQSVTGADSMLETRIRLAYANHLYDDQQQVLEAALSTEPLFTEEEQACIARAMVLPLYEQVQTLIDGLRLAEWDEATAYVMTFLDIVYQYAEDRVSDTGSFLTYWERKRDKVSIPSAQTSSAIQVMTVHKSKGLEFEVVLLPFLSWAVGSGTMDSRKLIWCEPTQAPFNKLPLLPVTCTKGLTKTHFVEEYARELRDLYMDNLNLSYVAFTRPKRELYAFGQRAQQTSKGEDSIRNVGNLFSVLLRDELDEEGVYEKGGASVREAAEKHETSAVVTREARYRSSSIGERLRLRTHAREEEEMNLQDFGTLMHDLLSEIETRSDAEKALTHYIYNGRARVEDEARIRGELERFWRLIADRDWFDGGYEVLREQDVLSPTGNTFRPDRVMLRGNEAIVIDYKFGEHRRSSYREQVRNYMSLLSQMGYRSSGYMVYVSLGEIEAV